MACGEFRNSSADGDACSDSLLGSSQAYIFHSALLISNFVNKILTMPCTHLFGWRSTLILVSRHFWMYLSQKDQMTVIYVTKPHWPHRLGALWRGTKINLNKVAANQILIDEMQT